MRRCSRVCLSEHADGVVILASEREELGATRSLVSAGSEIAGAAIGGALGFLAGGPGGAALAGMVGVAAARALGKVGGEVAERYLGPREKVRIGGVIALAAAQIDDRIKNGEALRSDGFFLSDNDIRSEADEAIESALLKAQREAEEKKLPFLANIIADASFNKALTRPMVQQILKISELLTYNQLCLLKLFSDSSNVKLESKGYADRDQFPFDLMQTLYEAFDLCSRGLVTNGGNATLSVKDVIPGSCKVQGLGEIMVQVLKLKDIPAGDLIEIKRLLAPQPIFSDLGLGGTRYTSSTNRP